MWSAAMDVGEWLKGIGLGQYEATFRAHDIDVDVLPDVTEADLEKIGLPLGARKRLMKAIANLRPPEGAAPEPSRPPAAPSPPPRTFRPDAERRPITVMFCDLVGSTALASRLDAEDWRSLVNAHWPALSHPPRRARGGARTVAPALGAGARWRGPACTHCRRTRHRQVASGGGVSRDAWRDAPHLGRILVVATVAEYAIAPDRRMGPTALRRG